MANTGNKIVLTLEQVDENNSDLPTGVTKTNVSTDPDYIAPYIDLSACPITYSLNCPTVRRTDSSATSSVLIEFSLDGSTFRNPAINKITIQIVNGVNTYSHDFTSITSGVDYFSYTFSSLVGIPSDYTFSLTYYDVTNTVIGSC